MMVKYSQTKAVDEVNVAEYYLTKKSLNTKNVYSIHKHQLSVSYHLLRNLAKAISLAFFAKYWFLKLI